MTILPLQLSDYRTSIDLDELTFVEPDATWDASVHAIFSELGASVPENVSTEEALHRLHGLLAPVDPFQLDVRLVEKIERIAAGVNKQQVRTDPLGLPNVSTQYSGNYPAADHTCIWVGDITQLGADVIVNAANSELLGCRLPNHACIDNAIHSAAGPRLRDDCATIIDRQQSHEQVGQAKITRGYALPARFVLHTVGPQLRPGSNPTVQERQQLVNAYRSCLDLASQVEVIRTIVFCAISTGVFSYPKREAAEIALTTVADWLEAHPQRFDRVIFNLYSTADARVYEDILDTYEGRQA